MRQAISQASRSKKKKVGAAARWFLPSLGSYCLLIILFLLVNNSSRLLLDSDTGWHIRAGELIIETGAVPQRDPFSHTMAGSEWFAWEWLSELIMAIAHRYWGLAGVVSGAILVLLASYDLLYRMMIRLGADAVVAFTVTMFATVAGVVHWLARPHLLSIALMALWYAAVEDFRRNRSRWIYFLPLMIALWANLHGAFVATFPVLAIYAAGEWVESVLRGEWRSAKWRGVLRTYALVGALSAVAALATPHGLRLYGHLWRYLNDAKLLSTINEFQSPNFHTLDGKLIEILLLLGAIACANAIRRRRFVETGLLILWGHMTLRSERHVTLAAVMLAPIIAEQFSALISEGADLAAGEMNKAARALRAAREWYREVMVIDRQLTGVFASGLVFVLVISMTVSGLAGKVAPSQFNPIRFPAAAADFISRTKPEGNMYSSDQFGGYLIYRLYPQFKVFVDGRSDFYRQGSVLDDYDRIATIKPQWSGLLDKYDIRWMTLRRDEPLALIALASGRWQSVYEDSVAQILIRKPVQ
ncbi:MAG TPA: hypothetical protein VJ810_18960 [Blastocatellia bacterium]|nr:hypothetical protein [Blastocatellia bacterium]